MTSTPSTAGIPNEMDLRPARILFVTPTFAPFIGGTATFAEVMARRLAARGHRMSVLTTTALQQTDFWQRPGSTGARPSSRELWDGVEVARLELAYPRPTPHAFGMVRRAGYWLHRSGLPQSLQSPVLRWLARQMPPLPTLPAALGQEVAGADLVQVFDSSWDGLFTLAVEVALGLGKPCAVAPLMHLGDVGIRTVYQMAHQRAAYRSASAVLALSSSEARAYSRLGVPADRVHVIAMGIDPCAWDPRQRAAAEALRHSQHLTRPTLAFLGANTYDKGAFALALAIAELAQEGLDVDAIYAGPLSELLTAFVREQSPVVRGSLKDKLHILGTVDAETKHLLLETCDLLALPSQVDSFGIVILEAWQHGKPVIGAAAGGLPDLIRSEETGLLVPFGDVPALAGAIRRLITEAETAKRLGEAGRREVLARYTWEHSYRTLSSVYAGLLSMGSPATFAE